MSNILWKTYHFCFSKFRCLPTSLTPPSPSKQDHTTPSLITNPTPPTLMRTFNSLYDLTSTTKSLATSSTVTNDHDFFSSSYDSDTDSLPDFTTVFASQRFFFSSPGHSNSIIVEYTPPESEALVTGGVAVPTLSPDPFTDFRRSMQEMVESREVEDVMTHWDFLHELLLCYLTLNPKHTHKVIVSAFSDLLVSLMSPESTGICRKTDRKHRCTTTSGQLV